MLRNPTTASMKPQSFVKFLWRLHQAAARLHPSIKQDTVIPQAEKSRRVVRPTRSTRQSAWPQPWHKFHERNITESDRIRSVLPEKCSENSPVPTWQSHPKSLESQHQFVPCVSAPCNAANRKEAPRPKSLHDCPVPENVF